MDPIQPAQLRWSACLGDCLSERGALWQAIQVGLPYLSCDGDCEQGFNGELYALLIGDEQGPQPFLDHRQWYARNLHSLVQRVHNRAVGSD